MKYHGTLTFTGKTWDFRTDSVAGRRLRGIFPGVSNQFGSIKIAHSPGNCEDLEWFLSRYPHELTNADRSVLATTTSALRAAAREAEELFSLEELPQPAEWNPAYPMRHYQQQAVELAHIKRGIIIGDDMGLGKTVEACGIMAAASARPALVVCYGHVQGQWEREIKKFLPSLRVHAVKMRKPYDMPVHDVTLCTYSKLDAIAERRKWACVIYDECQELRSGPTTDKGGAAKYLAEATEYRIGLSHTPVYGFAGEISHIMDCISPGALGSREEFIKEWAAGDIKGKVKDPEALGQFLREQRLYISRKKRDVGRELPPVHKVTQIIDFQHDALDRLKDEASALARTILKGSFHEKGMASRQLDLALRQATGIGKAPFVADTVATMVESGKKVVLGAWHREVFNILQREFRRRGIGSVLYTGSESMGQKEESRKKFMTDGNTHVFLMSNRSGAGLNGLQEVSNTCVFGEFDWSPKVHEQFAGRLHRDGQPDVVSVFYLMSEYGSDPVIAGILGVKDAQSTALTDPELLRVVSGTDTADDAERPFLSEMDRKNAEEGRGVALARAILKHA